MTPIRPAFVWFTACYQSSSILTILVTTPIIRYSNTTSASVGAPTLPRLLTNSIKMHTGQTRGKRVRVKIFRGERQFAQSDNDQHMLQAGCPALQRTIQTTLTHVASGLPCIPTYDSDNTNTRSGLYGMVQSLVTTLDSLRNGPVRGHGIGLYGMVRSEVTALDSTEWSSQR